MKRLTHYVVWSLFVGVAVAILMFSNAFTVERLFAQEHPPRPVKFMWNANTETDLAGYRLYRGPEARLPGINGPKDNHLYEKPPVDINDATAITYETTITPPAYYCFTLTAYDKTNNESNFSNEVCTSIDPYPAGLPIIINLGE